MINVNVSNNLQGVQGWDQLAGMVKTGETKAAGGAAVRIENDQIVVTVSDGKEMQSVTVSVPDLGAMDAVPDTAALQDIAAKIVALADSLAAVGSFNADGTAGPELQASISRLQSALTPMVGSSAPGNVAGSSGSGNKVGASNPYDPTASSMNTSKVLFDLFALMALMVEVAQKQRDTSREIRLSLLQSRLLGLDRLDEFLPAGSPPQGFRLGLRRGLGLHGVEIRLRRLGGAQEMRGLEVLRGCIHRLHRSGLLGERLRLLDQGQPAHDSGDDGRHDAERKGDCRN